LRICRIDLFLAESPINVALSVHALPEPCDFDPESVVNGKSVSNVAALRSVLDKLKTGDAVAVNVRRGSKLTLLAFELPSPASLGHGISAFAALLMREAG